MRELFLNIVWWKKAELSITNRWIFCKKRICPKDCQFIAVEQCAYDEVKEVGKVQLYVIANLHNQTVLDKKGIWMSTANSKSALRNVCWFDSPDVAKRACAPYNPNSVAVLTAKNLCKRIGIKKIPGYIQENYKGSVLSKIFLRIAKQFLAQK